MGGYLTAIIEVHDASDNRVDVLAKDGSAQPIILRLDSTFAVTSRDRGDGTTEVLLSAVPSGSGDSGTFSTVSFDVNLRATAITLIDTRPDYGHWKLVSIDLLVKTAVAPGGVSAVVRVGSTSGGQEIVVDQTVTSAAPAVVGGFALASLGSDMSQSTGFEAIYSAGQSVYVGVTVTGTASAGMLTAHLVWQELS